MNHVLSLDTSSIRYSILVIGSKDIFQYLKNHKHATVDKATTSIRHKNQIVTLNGKHIDECIFLPHLMFNYGFLI